MTEQEFKTAVAQILKDNIHFVQGDYVVFGALDKIWELHRSQLPSIKVTEFKPNIEVPDLVDIEQVDMTGQQERYFVDQRVGCIAIRDREHPYYDKDSPGLDSHTPGVVWLAMGYWTGKEWKIRQADIDRANIHVKILNDCTKAAKQLNQKGE